MPAPLTEITLSHDGNELARVLVPLGEWVIGRDSEAEICADTPLLSRKHARLTIHADHVLLEDLGSSNGSFVNDQPIRESTRLFPNQQIRLGDVQLEIRRQRATHAPEEPMEPAEETLRRVLPDELLTHKRYAIGTIVAQGGMGAILAAEQSAMKRDVAMKVMLANRDEGDVLRFIEEAQITGQLEHPNIVPVHEIGVDENDQLYYTMKMVRGITLQKVLDLLGQGLEGTVQKYPLAALLTIFQKACDAIAFAHSKGVIHRDLKPENLMLGDFGEVLVMDWGLAKVVGVARQPDRAGEARLPAHSIVASARHEEGSIGSTMMGTIMGTPQYMSPEQARGEVDDLDARSDIYALGAILFHILFLRPPLRGGEAMQIVRMVATGHVDWPAAAEAANRKLPHLPGGEVPESLEAVCRKALALDPSDRYASVADLQLDLTAYQTGFVTSAEDAGAWKQFRFFIRRNRAVSTAVAAAVLVVAAVTTVFTVKVVHARNRAETTLHELRGTAPTFADQARALVEAGQVDDALGKISYATQLDPKNLDYRLQRAHYLQVALRLHDAGTAYREVLGIRPGDPSAQKNLALCDRLLAANGGKDELPKPLLIELVNALLTQGRVIDANPLAQRIGQGTAATETALRARLKSVIAQPGWTGSRLRIQPNGSVYLNLNDLRLHDLNALRGFPISWLDVSDPDISDISPLAGMPLVHLSLSNTSVADLTPLAGSSLENLWLFNTPVRDFSPLRQTKVRELYLGSFNMTDLGALKGLKLEILSAYGNKITDLSPLRGMPLRQLMIGSNPVTDFSPLAGMPLERLDINYMDLAAIPPLTGLPLRSLNIGGNRISDLRPLAELTQLKNLYMPFSPIGDLSPLRKLPLQVLDLATEMRPVDLAPLADCRDLEDVILPRYFLHEEVLRTLPKMKRARVHILQQYAIPVPQFWTSLKPEWIGTAHLRTLLYLSGLKLPNNNPVQAESDGTFYLDLNRAEGAPLPSLAGLPVSRINLDNANITDLGPLRGLPLRRLSLNSSKVTDLTPLQGMSLVGLSFAGTGVTDISVLRGMPLQSINFSGAKLRAQDLPLLAAMPLEEVALNSTGLADVSFLRGKSLRRVEISGNGVSNLDFLAGAPVEYLNFSNTPISDLSPLRGKPLQVLQMGSTQVRDLSPLRGLPITEFTIHNTPIQDFTPLNDLPKLEKLRYAGPAGQFVSLRHHPTLKYISNVFNGPNILVEDFWAAYDAQQAKGKK